ncbi:phytosulfokines 3 [Dorcoceras hygrometricum]|uniref:Phytosulfokine n=1 Tax=Dorcoceras hygrometricum TaxID=472368 RepID=A0A2Z7A5P8_9LAMI|nr:phytosulfokines 3 [Dorcoceras hygrometricum]
MAKATTVFLLALLLVSSFSVSMSARPEPKLRGKQVETRQQAKWEEGNSCQGIEDEECLMRRTLAAHTDYIYTQKHNP